MSITDPSTIFRVLPHLLIEGTLYSPRTASLLAIVALTSHIPHLLEPANAFLEATRGTWINAVAPENFSTPFIRLILSVPSSQQLVLSPEEHVTYTSMARYAHLEENIDTKIQAKVPWTPMKTRGVGDRKRLCDGCGIRRSETMMHQVGTYVLGNMKATKEEIEKAHDDRMRCGMCVDSDTKDPKDWKDRGEIESCWVECSERWCRAQYVIEDEEGLRVCVGRPLQITSHHVDTYIFSRYPLGVTTAVNAGLLLGSNARDVPIGSSSPNRTESSRLTLRLRLCAPLVKIINIPDTRPSSTNSPPSDLFSSPTNMKLSGWGSDPFRRCSRAGRPSYSGSSMGMSSSPL